MDNYLIEQLKRYLAETPIEQQEKDWQEICKDIPVDVGEEMANEWIGHTEDIDEDVATSRARESFERGFRMGTMFGMWGKLPKDVQLS